MLKKARLLTRPTPARQDVLFHGQGRSACRAEEVQAAPRVGRSPLVWILANGKASTAIQISENLLWDAEDLNDARTLHGKGRIPARPGSGG